jgi:GNAT superfamily N-acetyltransferase
MRRSRLRSALSSVAKPTRLRIPRSLPQGWVVCCLSSDRALEMSEEDAAAFAGAVEEVTEEFAPAVLELFAVLDEHHPHEAHHYLPIVGTRPEEQGCGVGSALLAPVLEQCDQKACEPGPASFRGAPPPGGLVAVHHRMTYAVGGGTCPSWMSRFIWS